MSKAFQKVGLLGGIGPDATSYYYSHFFNFVRKKYLVLNNTDFPQIIINSIPAKELTSEQIYPEDIASYIEGLNLLSECSVSQVVILCNTANLFISEFRKSTDINILSPREILYENLKKFKIKKISVLGTHSTINSSLYDFDDIEKIAVEKNDIEWLEKEIIHYNVSCGCEEKSRMLIDGMVYKQMNAGAEMVILGCTEVAMMATKINGTIDPIEKTIEALADIIYKKEK